MDTMEINIQKAKSALTAATRLRLQDIEGLAYVAAHTTEPLLMIECIRRIKAHLEPLIDNVITLHHEEFGSATEDQVVSSKEGVNDALHQAGFDPAIVNSLNELINQLD